MSTQCFRPWVRVFQADVASGSWPQQSGALAVQSSIAAAWIRGGGGGYRVDAGAGARRSHEEPAVWGPRRPRVLEEILAEVLGDGIVAEQPPPDAVLAELGVEDVQRRVVGEAVGLAVAAEVAERQPHLLLLLAATDQRPPVGKVFQQLGRRPAVRAALALAQAGDEGRAVGQLVAPVEVGDGERAAVHHVDVLRGGREVEVERKAAVLARGPLVEEEHRPRLELGPPDPQLLLRQRRRVRQHQGRGRLGGGQRHSRGHRRRRALSLAEAIDRYRRRQRQRGRRGPAGNGHRGGGGGGRLRLRPWGGVDRAEARLRRGGGGGGRRGRGPEQREAARAQVVAACRAAVGGGGRGGALVAAAPREGVGVGEQGVAQRAARRHGCGRG